MQAQLQDRLRVGIDSARFTRSRARDETGRAGFQVAAAHVGVPGCPRPHRRRGSSRRRSPTARITTPALRPRHTSGTAASATRRGPGRPWRCAGTTSTSVPRETTGMAWDSRARSAWTATFDCRTVPLAAGNRGSFLPRSRPATPELYSGTRKLRGVSRGRICVDRRAVALQTVRTEETGAVIPHFPFLRRRAPGAPGVAELRGVNEWTPYPPFFGRIRWEFSTLSVGWAALLRRYIRGSASVSRIRC